MKLKMSNWFRIIGISLYSALGICWYKHQECMLRYYVTTNGTNNLFYATLYDLRAFALIWPMMSNNSWNNTYDHNLKLIEAVRYKNNQKNPKLESLTKIL